jgi:hypothetical protein
MTKAPMPAVALKPRWVALFGVLAGGSALLLAACGGAPSDAAVAHLGTTTTQAPKTHGSDPRRVSSSGPSGGGAGSSGSSGGGGQQFAMAGGNQGQMLAYSQCMQTHGVPNFPEPNSQGVVQGSGVNPSSPGFQKASKTCRHLLPNGGQPTPAQQAQAMAQALKFSECMRAHGLSDFPDPQSGPGGGIAIRIRAGQGQGSSDLNPQSPQFQAAQKACQNIMGGPLGGGVKSASNASGNK